MLVRQVEQLSWGESMDFLLDNWVDVLKVIGGVLSAGATLYGLIASRTRLRAKLRTDIEIYSKLDKDHEGRDDVKNAIDATIAKIYKPGKRSEKQTVLGFVFGLVMFAGFTWWSVSIYRNIEVSNWWISATGYGALIGLYFILQSGGIYDRIEKAEPAGGSQGSANN